MDDGSPRIAVAGGPQMLQGKQTTKDFVGTDPVSRLTLQAVTQDAAKAPFDTPQVVLLSLPRAGEHVFQPLRAATLCDKRGRSGPRKDIRRRVPRRYSNSPLLGGREDQVAQMLSASRHPVHREGTTPDRSP